MRKKLGGLVLLLGAIWLGSYLLAARERIVPVEVHYLLGDPPVAPRFQALYRQEGEHEPVARFATEMVSPDVVHKARLPPGRIAVEITLGEGPPFVRTIEARRDAVIRIELARDGGRP